MLTLLGAFYATAATIPIQEGFETYPDGTPINTNALTARGWGASSDAVVIRTVTNVNDGVRGTNAVVIPGWLTASNAASSDPLTNVWVDLYVSTNMGMSAGLAGEEGVDTNMTVQVFLETNGCPVVWNPASNAWVVYTQDAWQTNVSVFNTSQWARLTFCQNYSNKTASVFLNEHLMVSGLRFIDTSRTSYGRFEMLGGITTTSSFDQVAVAYAPPANMADVDDDGMSEADEIQLYGNTTNRSWRTVTVTQTNNGTVSPSGSFLMRPGGQTNFVLTANAGYYVADAFTNGQNAGSFPGRFTNSVATYTWTNMLSDGLSNGTFWAAFARKPQLTSAVSHVGGISPIGGTLTLSTNEVFPGGQVDCVMTGEAGYVVSSVLTNGAVEATFTGGARIRSYTLTNIWSSMTITAVFSYASSISVTNDYPTIQAAVSNAMDGTTISIVGGSYTNNVTLDKSVTLQGTNVTILGSLGIQSGMTGTLASCDGLVVTGSTTVANGAWLVVSNGVVDAGSVTVQAGGTVQVVNATAFVVDGATRTGTFTLDSNWGSTVVPQGPPYSDPFDRYAVGTKLSRMGYYGWGTSASNVVVQNTNVQSNRAVELPAGTSLASAMTTTPGSNVWVELYLQDTNRTASEQALAGDVDTNMAFQAFINTNGYVTVFDAEHWQWDVCSNDARSVLIANGLALNAWPRITVNLNYARGRAAVFLDGRLLRQELRFINTNLVNSGRVQVDSGFAGPTYLDTYSVRTNWVGIVSDDRDVDAWPDAMEIDQYGNTSKDPGVGSVYSIR